MKLFTLLSLSLCLYFNGNAAGSPGLNYNYYEGLWSNLPDFNTLTAVKKGTTANVSLDPRSKNMQYAFQWIGFITIPATGTYTFETFSDDGSKLYIGSTQVVNNDGEHAGLYATGSIALNAGAYPISITYFQSYGGHTMELYWSSNAGLARQKITDNVFTVNDPTATAVTAGPVIPLISTPTSTVDLTGINNYYFSTATGNDSRTPEQARNPATPWKTINKLNSIMSILKAGDAALFNRGETFYGSIKMAQSGAAGAPIIFSAYGTGNRPVISGLTSVKTWTSMGNGVWEANLASGANLNMVLFNNIVQPMGRFPNSNLPNKGFLTIDSHSGTSQITDNDLGSATNWSGAEIVVRKNDWTLDRAPIKVHTGNILNFVSPTGHQPIDGYGYFIQNSPLTLDDTGEWYYNPAAKKLSMYFGSENPAAYSIVASTIDTLVFINNNNYLTFNNLALRGADVAAFQLNNSANIRVQNCDINFTGLDGISAENSPYMSIENCAVKNSNNSGIRLYQGSSYATIKNNAVKNSGLIAGMGSSNNQQHDGIFVDASPSNIIELNKVDSSGYCGIVFTGDYTTVKNNIVNYFCLTVNDGGGIYTWGGWDKVGRKITGNIVLNGIGAPAGTNNTNPGGAVGIYTDDRSSNIDITNNTIAHCVRAGIYLHNSHEMNLTGNTLYNNGIQLSMVHDALEPADPIRNIATTGNILSSSKGNQLLVENESTLIDIAQFGTYNNNYYMRPIDESGIITTNVLHNGQYKAGFYDLSGWKVAYGFDQQSSKSPVIIPAYNVNRLIGVNKYSNGSFNSNAAGVVCLSSPATGSATFNRDGKLDGGGLQVSFDVSSGITNDVGIYLDFGMVTAGKSYLVKFSLLGSSIGKTIKCFTLQNGGSYSKLSEVRCYSLTTSRTENQFIFTAPVSVSNAMLALEITGTSCPYWLDNLQVYEAEVCAVNTDDYMRLEYNSTTANKSFTLTGTYVDAKNKLYSGKISLAPFTSLVLMKQPAIGLQAVTQTTSTGLITTNMIVAEPEITQVKVYPNPVRDMMQVALAIPVNTLNTSLNIYSTNGIKLKTMIISNTATSMAVDVTFLISGKYIMNIVCDGQMTSRMFVKS